MMMTEQRVMMTEHGGGDDRMGGGMMTEQVDADTRPVSDHVPAVLHNHRAETARVSTPLA